MEIVPKNVHWLLPEEPTPCDIFLHFRGQYAVAVPKGQAVSFKLLEKLAKAQTDEVYVKSGDLAAWNEWCQLRHPGPGKMPSEKDDDTAEKTLYGNKRAELLSYMQKTISKRAEEDDPLNRAFTEALAVMQKVVKQPTLDWYFKQFHEPPDLFQHNGRVAYGLAIFLSLRKMATAEEVESICYSALIHELEGDPVENMKKVPSQRTLALLEEGQQPVPKGVIELIEMHDELCSGKGFPNNKSRAEIPAVVRLFSLFNHFDSYRLQHTGTRRARFEQTKQKMEQRQADYDTALWKLFWHFWEKQVEAIT